MAIVRSVPTNTEPSAPLDRSRREMFSTTNATRRIEPTGRSKGSQRRSRRSSFILCFSLALLTAGASERSATATLPEDSVVFVSCSLIYFLSPISINSRSISRSALSGRLRDSSEAAHRKKITAITAQIRSPAPIFMMSPAIS